MRTHPLQLTCIRFTTASPEDETHGLLGFVRFHLGGIAVDGVTLRRTREGRLTLSWPAPRGFPLVRPLDDEARRTIERQVFAALDLQEARS
jgi:hypothetical protein